MNNITTVVKIKTYKERKIHKHALLQIQNAILQRTGACSKLKGKQNVKRTYLVPKT